jgi:hypothetical protein
VVRRPRLVLADDLADPRGDYLLLLRRLAEEGRCASLVVSDDSPIVYGADRRITMQDGCIVPNPSVQGGPFPHPDGP